MPAHEYTSYADTAALFQGNAVLCLAMSFLASGRLRYILKVQRDALKTEGINLSILANVLTLNKTGFNIQIYACMQAFECLYLHGSKGLGDMAPWAHLYFGTLSLSLSM